VKDFYTWTYCIQHTLRDCGLGAPAMHPKGVVVWGGMGGGGSGPSDNCSGSAPCPLTDWSRTDSFHIIWLIVFIFLFFSVSVIRLQFPSADGNYVGFKPKRSSGPPAKKRKWVVFVLFIFCFRNRCRNPGLCSACPLLCVPLLCVPLLCVPTALRAHCSSFDQFR
jgi:phosphatidylglycerophosphate synthase